MSITVLLVLIIVLAFLIGGVVERWLPKIVSRSGIEYALLGILLGEQAGFGVLGTTELLTLDPFLQMILGLVGFILGLRGRDLFQQRGMAVAGLIASVGCFASVAVFIALLLMNSAVFTPAAGAADTLLYSRQLGVWFDNTFALTLSEQHVRASLGLAAAVSVSSLGVSAMTNHKEGAVTRFLKASASASQVVGILALGLLLAAARAVDDENRFSLSIWEWTIAATAFGLICGALFVLFIGREQDRMRIFLATVGLVTFASGTGVALGVSPMFINLIAGMTVAAASSHALTLHTELRRLERPLRIIVMVFVGALWSAPEPQWWALAVLVFFARWGLKRFWTFASHHWVLQDALGVRKLGDGVLSQGAVAAAIGASFAHEQTDTQRSWVLSTVLVVSLLSDFLSEGRWRALLYSAGEADEAAELGPGSSEL